MVVKNPLCIWTTFSLFLSLLWNTYVGFIVHSTTISLDVLKVIKLKLILNVLLWWREWLKYQLNSFTEEWNDLNLNVFSFLMHKACYRFKQEKLLLDVNWNPRKQFTSYWNRGLQSPLHIKTFFWLDGKAMQLLVGVSVHSCDSDLVFELHPQEKEKKVDLKGASWLFSFFFYFGGELKSYDRQ